MRSAKVLCCLLALTAVVLVEGGSCNSLNEYLAANLRAGEQAFRLNAADSTEFHVECYAVNESAAGELYISQKVTTELFSGELGIASSTVHEDENYPCEGQSLWGSIQFRVESVNNVQAYDVEAQSMTYNNEPACSDGDHYMLFENLHITQVVNQHLTIDTHFFKNDAAQAAANLDHTMTIGSMDECKLEAIYAFKPKSGTGGLSVVAEVQLHAGLEEVANGAITGILDVANNKLRMSIPAAKLVEASGLGPTGCTPNTENITSEEQPVIDVSTKVTCASTGAVVFATAVFEKSSDPSSAHRLRLDVSATDAPESCNIMYWDPLVTPMKVDETGESISSGGSSLDPLLVVLPVLAVVLIAGAVFVIRRKKLKAAEASDKTESKAQPL